MACSTGTDAPSGAAVGCVCGASRCSRGGAGARGALPTPASSHSGSRRRLAWILPSLAGSRSALAARRIGGPWRASLTPRALLNSVGAGVPTFRLSTSALSPRSTSPVPPQWVTPAARTSSRSVRAGHSRPPSGEGCTLSPVHSVRGPARARALAVIRNGTHYDTVRAHRRGALGACAQHAPHFATPMYA